MKIKEKLKSYVESCPAIWSIYKIIKSSFKHVWMLRYYLYDIKMVYKYSKWGVNGSHEANALTAEVIFNSHKLEKGLCLSNGKRIFAVDPAKRLLFLLKRWKTENIVGLDNNIFISSLGILKDYKIHLLTNNLKHPQLMSEIDSFIEASSMSEKVGSLPQTPYIIDSNQNWSELTTTFTKLAKLRRSVRDFSDELVPQEKIMLAVELAQLSPSACNRQPCKVHILQNQKEVQEILLHQNGNRGFNEKISTIAIVTADITGYFDATERNQGYVDGGLFLMSFLYGLEAQGISSCCLNWCAKPNTDRKVHDIFNIKMSERIISLVAIGYPNKTSLIPLSPRKLTSNIVSVR